MASPFKWFRKNQKAAFVVLGVMAMISFIVLPAILQLIGSSGGAANVTFATSRYGKVDGRELAIITDNIANLAQFYEQLAFEIGVEYQRTPEALAQEAGFLRSISPDQAIEWWLIVQYMRHEGFEVSREEAGAYLSRLTYNPEIAQSYATENMFRKTVNSLNRLNGGFSDTYVIGLIANRILVEQFYEMSSASVRALTPATEFDWHNRFNRQVKVEVIPVSVSDFTAQVDAPGKREMKKFFEENKFRDRNPTALESGFSIPLTVTLEYVSFDKDMIKPEEVTDEEVEKYYEEYKELFVEQPMTIPGFGGLPTPGATGVFDFPPAPEGEAVPQIDDIVPADTDETVTQPDVDTPVEPAVEPTTEPAIEQPADQPVEPTTENVTEPTAEPTAEESETVEPTSWNGRNIPIRLVSYQADGEQADGESDVEANDDAGVEAVTDDTTDDVTESTEQPESGDSTETETNIDTGTPPIITIPPGSGFGGSTLDGSTLGGSSLGGSTFGGGLGGSTSPFGQTLIPTLGGSTNPALASTPVTYRPLDDTLKDEIRERLARQKMLEKFQQVQDAMAEHYREHIKAIQQNREEPLPDIAALAKKLGLKYTRLERVDYYGLLDTHYDFAVSRFEMNDDYFAVIQGLFSDQRVMAEKRSMRSLNSNEESEYIFWVTKFTEPKIPVFDDEGMAEQVEARWRMVQARPLAEKKAEELAEIAKKADGSFLEYFTAHPNKDVKAMTETEFFTWLTVGFGNNYMPVANLSEVREMGVLPRESLRDNVVLKNLGKDFMQAVYNLEPGQVTVTHNGPQDTFYIVRLIETVPSDEEAFDAFAMDSVFSKYIYQYEAMQERGRQLQEGAIKTIFDKTKFQWKVKPSEYRQMEELKAQESQQERQSDNRGPAPQNVPPNVPRF